MSVFEVLTGAILGTLITLGLIDAIHWLAIWLG